MGKKIGSLFWEIGADSSKLKSGLEDSKSQVSGMKSTFMEAAAKIDLAKRAVRVFSGTFKAAMDTGKEGAALEYAADKFDKLSASIGTTSDALLGDLRNATKGTRTDAELMASAGDLMALGLAKSYDQVVRLTTVAGALNMDMNQLVLTLANKTTMRFDQLGVSVDGFSEKVDALKASGMSADDAFGEAFLQQAEQQVALLGDAADGSVGDFKRMEVAMQNAGDAAKLVLAPALTRAAIGVTALLTNAKNINTTFMQHVQTVGQTSGSYQEYRAELARTAEIVGARVSQEGIYDAYLTRTGDKIRVMSEAEWEAQQAAEASDRSLMGMATTLEGNVVPAAEAGAIAISGVKDAAYTADDVMRGYTDALLFNIASQDLDATSALNLAKQMGLVDGNTELAYIKTAELKDALASGAITMDEYTTKTLALQDAIDRLQDKEITVKVNFDSVYAFGASDSALPGVNVGPVEEEYATGTGGWKTVPPGYSNDSYRIGLTSGEQYYVGASGSQPPAGAGGGGVTIQALSVTLPGVTNAQGFVAELGKLSNRSALAGMRSAGG